MTELSNPTTTGLDGGDSPEWHDEQREVDGYMVTAVLLLAAVVLAAMATVTTQPPVLVQWWQLIGAMSLAALVGFLGGVVAMAACAMAGYSDDKAGA